MAARTDIGLKREANEDSFAIDEARGFFVVADGLGGHVAGRVASELAVELIATTLRDRGDCEPFQVLRDACRRSHQAIVERTSQDPALQGMGTTVAALWIRGGRAALGHVGDSRVYLLRYEKLHQLTFDHSVVREMELRGELSADEARHHPYRHVITRAIGVGVALEPDLVEIALRPGDRFVLCTDGISGPIEDDDLLGILEDAGSDVGAAADALIELANRRGGEDNSTVIIVDVEPGS